MFYKQTQIGHMANLHDKEGQMCDLQDYLVQFESTKTQDHRKTTIGCKMLSSMGSS